MHPQFFFVTTAVAIGTFLVWPVQVKTHRLKYGSIFQPGEGELIRTKTKTTGRVESKQDGSWIITKTKFPATKRGPTISAHRYSSVFFQNKRQQETGKNEPSDASSCRGRAYVRGRKENKRRPSFMTEVCGLVNRWTPRG
jgi:hypothetical protein